MLKRSKLLTVPALGFGTWSLSRDAAREGVRHALELGYRHIATAAACGNQEAVGQGWRAAGLPRSRIFLTSEVRLEDLSTESVRASIAQSLEQLGTRYLNLALIQWPPPDGPVEPALAILSELRRRGRVRHLGVSNCPVPSLRQLSTLAPIACNQVEYHPWRAQPALLRLARARGIFVATHAPLARGAVAEDETLQRIGRRYDRSAAQVALRWLLQQRPVLALPHAADPARRREHLGALDFQLEPADMAAIHGLSRGHSPVDADFALS